MKPLLLFLLLALLPATAAFNCSYFANQTDCQAALSVNEDLIANLIYTNTSHPDHATIATYNQDVVVNDAPTGYVKRQKGVIMDAWVALLTIQPSVIENETRYCPAKITVRSEGKYWIKVPADYDNPKKRNGATCKIRHYLQENTSKFTTKANTVVKGTGKIVTINPLTVNAVILEELSIRAKIKNDYYTWQKYCCRSRNGRCVKYCWKCPKTKTNYTIDTLTVNDTTNTTYDRHVLNANFTLIANYSGTTKGLLVHDENTSVWLSLGQSNYSSRERVYTANFTKKPFDLLELYADTVHVEEAENLLWNNGTFYVANATNCTLKAEDFFKNQTEPCSQNLTEPPGAAFEPPSVVIDWVFILKMLVFAALMVAAYGVARKYWRKLPGLGLALILATPMVLADDCGLTNLASCLPGAFYSFILGMINAPLAPLLGLVKSLLEASPDISLFQGVWAIIVYCLSLFYGFLFIYSGYQFLTSGHNVLKREMAKEWLKNTVIMIVLVQASYYLYGLIVQIGGLMSQAVLSLVNPLFFLLTADNITNVGLEFLLVSAYVLILLVTMIFLVMRYLIVAFGVLFAPIGIFCYFLPPLRSYGQLILNLLGLCIFITFLDAIIILACSQLITLPIFENFKIVVMINCFLLVDLLFLLLVKHVANKTGMSDAAASIAQAAKYVGAMM